MTTTPVGADAVLHNITHELGHGVVHSAAQTPGGRAAADPALDEDYQRTVGWLPHHPVLGQPVLLDSGSPITSSNWSDARWVEKPPTAASLGGPAADLTESMAAYVTSQLSLQGRSPARHRFLHSREAVWRSALTHPGPEPQGPGDFPPGPTDRALA
jgi:hypothetical protein